MKKPTPQSQLSAAVVVSLLALAVSIMSAYQTRQLARDNSDSAIIQASYAVFRDLTQTQVANPDCSHVFVPGRLYASVAANVKVSVSARTHPELAGLRLKESAIALRIFTHFEEALYQFNQANAAGDKRRAHFLKEVLDYFTGRLLRNPRLLWYWSESGGGQSVFFEEGTNAYYNAQVLNAAAAPLAEKPDPVGPLSDQPEQASPASR